MLNPDRPAGQRSTLRGQPPEAGDIRDLARLLDALSRWSGIARPALLRSCSEVIGEKDGQLVAQPPGRNPVTLAALDTPVPLGMSLPASSRPSPPTREAMPARAAGDGPRAGARNERHPRPGSVTAHAAGTAHPMTVTRRRRLDAVPAAATPGQFTTAHAPPTPRALSPAGTAARVFLERQAVMSGPAVPGWVPDFPPVRSARITSPRPRTQPAPGNSR